MIVCKVQICEGAIVDSVQGAKAPHKGCTEVLSTNAILNLSTDGSNATCLQTGWLRGCSTEKGNIAWQQNIHDTIHRDAPVALAVHDHSVRLGMCHTHPVAPEVG